MKNPTDNRPAPARLFLGNTESAFRSKGDRELKRSYWLYSLMGSPWLVRLFSRLAVFSVKAGLPVSPLIRNTIYKQFCAGESLEESQSTVHLLNAYKVGSILDYSVEGKERQEDFDRTVQELVKILQIASLQPAIPYTSLKLTGLVRTGLLEKLNEGTKLSPAERQEEEAFVQRLNTVFRQASNYHVPLYIDAEESWIQDAIDRIAEDGMRQYNHEKAIVLTTLQMYRWDRLEYLQKLIRQSKEGGYFIGIKLVRGAYMEKENRRAEEKGYRSPIQPDKKSTDRDFDRAVRICLENIGRIVLCAGTHNEASTLYLVDTMKELGIPNDHPHVYFSQLYGMSDHITFNLAEQGYNVTKYLPYGPVRSTLPYLVRRAEENTAIAGQIGRELSLIVQERNRRKSARLLESGK